MPKQWGIATGSKATTHTVSKFTVTLPINYQKQIAQVLVTVGDGGYDGSWEGTTAWGQDVTIKSFAGYMVAAHPFTISPKIRWVTLGE